MKYLILLRHANAKNPAKYNSDFERPLSSRGRSQCPLAAEEIARLVKDDLLPAPELLLSSPAARTLGTIEHFSSAFKESYSGSWSPKIEYDENLYLPRIDEILDSIWGAADADSLLVCSHNPGISYLAEALFGYLDGYLATAGWAAGSFDADSWQEINKVNSRLIDTGGPYISRH